LYPAINPRVDKDALGIELEYRYSPKVPDSEHLRALVERALHSFDEPATPTSAILRQCIRIARLRNDFTNLFWLEHEARDGSASPEYFKERLAEYALHFEEDEWLRMRESHVRDFTSRRDLNDKDGNVWGGSIEHLEAAIAGMEQEAAESVPPPGLAPVDLFFRSEQDRKTRRELKAQIVPLRRILTRLRLRLHAFLVETEAQLEYGQINADIFERTRRFVDEQLAAISPDALTQFQAVYRRIQEGDIEARSHALTSCRRILKTLADSVYPSSADAAIDEEGNSHKLDDSRYLNRILQFVREEVGKHGTGEVVQAVLSGLGTRLRTLDSLASKGVHATVTADEVDACVIQTYLVVGDVLRIKSGSSPRSPI
jgi:hypothetical protein